MATEPETKYGLPDLTDEDLDGIEDMDHADSETVEASLPADSFDAKTADANSREEH